MASCVCAQNKDGTKTTILCPVHADTDPCLTVAHVTGKRRKGTMRRGQCTNCGWLAPRRRQKTSTRFEVRPCVNVTGGWDVLDHERKRAIPFMEEDTARTHCAVFIEHPEQVDEFGSNEWCYTKQNV